MTDLEESFELENIGIEVGTSRNDTIQTAVKHFDKYLTHLRRSEPTIEILTNFENLNNDTVKLITKDIMGKFSDYLIRVAKIKTLNTCLGYLSCIKCKLEARFDFIETTQFAGKWYKTLRAKITSRYAIECKENGQRLVNSAPPMKERDLIMLNEVLLKHNDRESDMNRCLFTWQWQTLGRISEICGLKCSMLKVHDSREIKNAMSLMMSRLKTSVESDMMVFIHADTYEVCPFHALATMLITNNPTDVLFPTIPHGSESQYVNKLLARLLEELSDENSAAYKMTERLLSHSMRSGGATFANEHSDIQTSWIVLRGGWTLEGLQTIFNYLCGTVKTDSRVGRALSGWPSALRGGNCPSMECIPEEDRELFRVYCTHLLACAAPELQHPLMCSLLLHWHAMYRDCPEHALISRMLFSETGVTIEHVERWALAVRRAFRNMNAPFLPVSELAPTDAVPYATIEEFFAKTIESLDLVRTQLGEEVIKREESDRRARAAAESMERMEALIRTLIAGQISEGRASLSSPVQSVLPEVTAVTPATGTALSFGSPPTRTRSAQRVHSDVNTSPAVITRPWPSDLKSLADLTVGSLFTRWYMDELYNCKHSTPLERQHFNTCAKLVEYCKYFLPGGTVIMQKPREASALIPWRQQLTAWGQLVNDKAHQFAVDEKARLKPTQKRKRASLAVVPATYKRLTEIDNRCKAEGGLKSRVDSVAPQTPPVIDQATTLVAI